MNNRVMANIYKKLVDNGRIDESMVPEDIRVDEDSNIAASVNEELSSANEIHGAVSLEKIVRFVKPVKGVMKDPVSASKLFEKLNPKPEAVQYEIIRVEKSYLGIKGDLIVEIGNTSNGFEIDAKFAHGSGEFLFRVDVGITSANYEPMHVMIYYNLSD